MNAQLVTISFLRSSRNSLLTLMMPMLPGVVVAHQLQIYRPLFWAEFLISTLATRGKPLLFCISLVLCWAADFLFIFGQVNLSSSYLSALDLLTYIPYTNIGWIVMGAAGLIFLSGWTWACVKVHASVCSNLQLVGWSLAILGIALSAPTWNGFDHSEGKIYNVRKENLAGSWLLDSKFLHDTFAFYEEGYPEDFGQFSTLGTKGSAVKRVLNDKKIPSKILLVVVESWGLARNERENQFWRNLWATKSWDLESGSIQSLGATLQGEFRELCGLFPHSLRIESIPEAQSCLPNILKSKGWHTQAFHSASAKMYRRDEWYPKIGFEETFFMPELLAGSSRCANIPGVCDYSIVDRVIGTLMKDGNQLTYWMTLNSHPPYRESDLSTASVTRNICPELNLQDDRCLHAALIFDFMNALKSGLQAHPIPGLQLIMVGDHAPKFFEASSRDQFDESSVPYISIRIPR